jgi:site-specific DNA recombinase
MSMDDKRRNYKAKQNECVLMARVSSRDQEVEGYSLPAQVRILKDYCLRKDLTILKIFEISESASGKKQRELFNEVLRYIADNKVKVLVCEKVDRLTRNFKDAVMIDDWLETDEHHEVHLVKDSLIMHKYSRSQEKFNWGLRVLFAKNTIDNLREEVDKGVREKLEQGWLPGKPLTGYKTVGDSGRKIHVPDPQMGLLMREAFELYDSGNYSLKLLVGTMKEKGLRTHFGRPLVKSQLHRLLSNPFYIGKMTWKGKLYDGKHEPLIGVELFERVQERMKRKRTPKYSKHNPVFKGLMRCIECGGTIAWETQREHWYGHCNHFKPCTQRAYVRQEDVEKHLLSEFAELVSPSPDVIAWVKETLRAKYEADMEARIALKKQLNDRYQQLGRRMEIMYEDRLDGRLSVHQYDKMHKEASNEQKIISKKLEDFEDDYLAILERGINVLDLSQKASAIYESKNDTDRRAILRDLFSNIHLNGKLIEVERTPLVAAIANKVRKEKELRNTFEQTINSKLTEEEFVNRTLSPLWLGMRDSNPRMPVPKTGALPLGQSPIFACEQGNFTANGRFIQPSGWVRLPGM